jgi:hypothetical protein
MHHVQLPYGRNQLLPQVLIQFRQVLHRFHDVRDDLPNIAIFVTDQQLHQPFGGPCGAHSSAANFW